MADNFSDNSPGLVGPAENAFSITPADGSDLTTATRGLYVGVSGDVKVDLVGGDTITFVSLSAGLIHPIRASKVYSTSTTATSIVGVY